MSIIKNLSNVITGDLNQEIEALKRTAESQKITINLLKMQNAILNMRLSQSHLRDPKTGRIMPKGKHVILDNSSGG